MLISVAFASGAMLLWPVVQGASSTGLSPAGAVQLINRERALVIDVSEADEFAAGHVGGARNVPMSKLEQRLISVAAELPHVYIIKEGLKEGDRILLEGLRKVHKGQTIVANFRPPEQVLAGLNLYAE